MPCRGVGRMGDVKKRKKGARWNIEKRSPHPLRNDLQVQLCSSAHSLSHHHDQGVTHWKVNEKPMITKLRFMGIKQR